MGIKDCARFCVFVIAILSVRTQWVNEEQFCRTPSGEVGDCIVVGSCKPIMDILDAAPQPLPRKVVNLLKAYHCGFIGNQPRVCCPSKPIYVEGINVGAGKPAAETPPPDVSGHRNIGLLPRDCGRLETGDKIILGNKTNLFEFPWMALLSYKTNRGPDFRCGATILNDRYILTAAHCITNLKSPLLGVRVGEHDIRTPIDCQTTMEGEKVCAPPFQDLTIEEIIPHADYNAKLFTNDIGILRVTKMDFTQEHIRPVCLPLERSRTYNFTGRNCVVTGWGATESGRASPELLKAEIPVLTNEDCSSRYKNLTTIQYRQLCAGGRKGSDSCGGDSGGPLHVAANQHGDVRLIQQGVVSFGPRDCGNTPFPGVYTRVAYYMDWILNNIRA